MIGLKTIKKTLIAAGLSFLAGAAGAFIVIPVNVENPKSYLMTLLAGLISGGLVGLQEFVRNYLKHDKKHI